MQIAFDIKFRDRQSLSHITQLYDRGGHKGEYSDRQYVRPLILANLVGRKVTAINANDA